MELTILSDNRTVNPEFTTEHGLSIFLKSEKFSVLLDTGAGGNFITNARKSGINLESADYVFLSHGHSDHTGGFSKFSEINDKAVIIASPIALNGKFYSERNHLHSLTAEIKTDNIKNRLQLFDKTTDLPNGIRIIAEIPQKFSLPSGNRHLFIENADCKLVTDTFRHEIAFYYNGFLFTGCAHNGIENILSACEKPVKTVVGGFHLLDAKNGEEYESDSELTEIARRLAENYPQTVFYTGHCTGNQAFNTMHKILGDNLRQFYCGQKIILPN